MAKFNLQTFIRKPKIVWYGPHACARCGLTIVRSSESSGGVELDATNHNRNYPNFNWQEHKCGEKKA